MHPVESGPTIPTAWAPSANAHQRQVESPREFEWAGSQEVDAGETKRAARPATGRARLRRVASETKPMTSPQCVTAEQLAEAAPQFDGFTWGQVNCFLRPQAMLADAACAGAGMPFVFLASICRAWNHGVRSRLWGRHTEFLMQIAERELPLVARVTSLHRRSPSATARCLRQGPALVPVGIASGGSPRGRVQPVRPHYLLVCMVDGAGEYASIVDNVLGNGSPTSLEYRTHRLSVSALLKMIDDYGSQTGPRLSSMLGMPNSAWVIQINPKRVGDTYAVERARELMQRLARAVGRAPDARSYDTRHAARLRRLDPTTPAAVRHVRRYLADAKLSSVYLDCLAQYGQAEWTGRPHKLATGLAESDAVRNAALARYLAGGQSWSDWTTTVAYLNEVHRATLSAVL